MYTQTFAPVAHSIGASAAFAALPLLILFVLLGVLRVQARWAALASLAVSMAVAILVYGMPANQTASGALEGAAIGFFPIIWIGINAIWLFKLTQESGHADVLRRALARVSADQRVQAVLIAFCFGALLEALAGGGAPVAICAVLLISIGVEPLKAAAVCLIADTSPVAFGALGLPITVLAKITRLPVHEISVMVGRQTPLLSLFIPLILVFIVDGRRGLKEVWPLALVAGIVFALAQFAGSMLLPVELVDIVWSAQAFRSCSCASGRRACCAPTWLARPRPLRIPAASGVLSPAATWRVCLTAPPWPCQPRAQERISIMQPSEAMHLPTPPRRPIRAPRSCARSRPTAP
jgi:lactate permease